MNKFFAIIILAVIIVGGYFLFSKTYQETSMPADEQALSQKSAEKAPIKEKIITYTDAGYSPSSLQIKVGETVIFKNESSQSMWPASAIHPAHNDYPTTGGCIGSAFDACQGVQPDDNWSFRFDIVGNWKYHDHLNPKNFGAIVVE